MLPDLDVLGDGMPPRHAVESDEEDELNPLSQVDSTPSLEFSLKGSIPAGQHLVFASGQAAASWAKGAHLGEQQGAVAINGSQIALLFRPSWSQAVVATSEVTTELPFWAVYDYVSFVCEKLRPASATILDTYSVPTYVTGASPVSFYDAPIRFLYNAKEAAKNTAKAMHFDPPNLLQGTSAALISLLEARRVPVLAVLLPAPTVSRPPPKILQPPDFTRIWTDGSVWSSETMQDASVLLSPNGSPPPWQSTSSAERKHVISRRPVGDSDLYI